MTADEAAQLVADVFVKGRADASALARHALDCLAWMIATETLRLRIAVPTPESNYHPENLALRRRRESGARPRLGQRNRPRSEPRVSSTSMSTCRGSRRAKTESRAGSPCSTIGRKEKASGLRRSSNCLWLWRKTSSEWHLTGRLNPVTTRPLRGVKAKSEALSLCSERRLRIPSYLEWTQGPYAHQVRGGQGMGGSEHSRDRRDRHGDGGGEDAHCAHLCNTKPGSVERRSRSLLSCRLRRVPLIMQWQRRGEEVRRDPRRPEPGDETPTGHSPASSEAFKAAERMSSIVTNNLLCASEGFKPPSPEKLRIRGRYDPGDADCRRSPYAGGGVVHQEQTGVLREAARTLGNPGTPVRSRRNRRDLRVLRSDRVRVRLGPRHRILLGPIQLLRPMRAR